MIKKVIYISGVARSGTSWISQIINSAPNVRFKFQPLFSYEFRDQINEDSSKEELYRFYENLFVSEVDFLLQKDKVLAGTYPVFSKKDETVLAFKDNGFQSFIEPMLRKTNNMLFVGVIRNPNATLYSWTQNEKEFPKGSDILQEWRFANCKNNGNEDYFGYYKWKEVANLYLDLEQKYGDRVQILHYDAFLNKTEEKVEALFDKLGIPFSNQTQEFLSVSGAGKDTDYYSVFKSKKNKDEWKSKLPLYIQQEIQADLKGTRLEKYLH